MKKTLVSLALLGILALPVAAQQLYTKSADGTFAPVVINTNSSPFLSGPLVDLLGQLSIATNWGVATFGIYEPATSHSKAAAGGGAVFLYNINKYVATGVGVDWMDNQVTMPSGQLQFQAPLLIGGTNGVTVTPFAFTGVATAMGGMGSSNGNVEGLFGAGLDVKIWGGLGAFYAIEERTGQPAPWNLFGLRWSMAF